MTTLSPSTEKSRVVSIDILRALTMVLMIFVNDLWSLQDIPSWLMHVSRDTDGMGLADVIFPAFLFIVGMSIPLAVEQRKGRGESQLQRIGHVLLRSLALIVMGLFLVNGEYIHEASTGMKRVVWNSLSCFAFILLWNNYSSGFKKSWKTGFRIMGVSMLLALAFLYQGGTEDARYGFSTHWWGILGLIGWSYLLAALIYLFSAEKIYVLAGTWVLLLVLNVCSQAGLLASFPLWPILGPLGGGALPLLVMGGVVTTSFLRYSQRHLVPAWKFIFILLIMASVLTIMGFSLRAFGGISKLQSTPSWALLCSAITLVAFCIVYWLGDVKKKGGWFSLIQPAGRGTLLCYLLPYFAYAFVNLSGIQWPDIMLTGFTGLIKSFVFALLCALTTGWLLKQDINLKV